MLWVVVAQVEVPPERQVDHLTVGVLLMPGNIEAPVEIGQYPVLVYEHQHAVPFSFPLGIGRQAPPPELATGRATSTVPLQ